MYSTSTKFPHIMSDKHAVIIAITYVASTYIAVLIISVFLLFLDAPNNSGSSGIIGGAMGGVMLLLVLIIVLLCIVILYTRFYKKGKFPVDIDDKVLYNTTDLNPNVTMNHNPSYDVTNPITLGDSNVPMTTNPSYDIFTTKSCNNEVSKDEYYYVQPNEFRQHSETIKMDANPSYGVSTGEGRATSFNTTITKFDDAKVHQSSHNATNKQCDYDYAYDDQLLHHNTTTNATDSSTADQSRDIKNAYLTLIAGSAKQSKCSV